MNHRLNNIEEVYNKLQEIIMLNALSQSERVTRVWSLTARIEIARAAADS